MKEPRTAAERERLFREHIRRVKAKYPELFSPEYNKRFFRFHQESRDIEFQVEAARAGDKDAIKILREYARGARQHPNVQAPRALHEFVWECFIDGEPKAKTGTGPKETDLTYLTIALLVRMGNRDYGFPLDQGAVTAISIVADQLKLSESWVRKIWEKWGKAASAKGQPAAPH
jgi:hypothetical protein